MSFVDFETEKALFRQYYDSNVESLQAAGAASARILSTLFPAAGHIPISKIEARVKSREECINKFNLKYRPGLEASDVAYTIREHITDLVGLRIVCLYEDDIRKIGDVLSQHFEVIDTTDKIAAIENTESSFGYKGLHFDVRMKAPRLDLPEYQMHANLPFEIQVRTIVQDSWSVLDHKIKYKKSIPASLKRRINTLAALFELADREFRAIRDETEDELRKAEAQPQEDGEIVSAQDIVSQAEPLLESTLPGNPPRKVQSARLTAFNFLKIVSHFFPQFAFEPHKVDGFVQQILECQPQMTRALLNGLVTKNIGTVKQYQSAFEARDSSNRLNPFTVIRHSLYLADRALFASLLTAVAKASFEAWLTEEGHPQAVVAGSIYSAA